MKWWNEMRARYCLRTSPYTGPLREIPGDLFAQWQQEAGQEFPGIPTDAFFFARSVEGLMRFFDCIRHSGKPCALPSRAADSVWHVWMRRHGFELERFTRKHFGRVIPHVEAGQMSGQMAEALAHTLVAARELEGIPTAGPRVPKLFRLDGDLRMPGGYGYKAERGEVGYAHLGDDGKPETYLIYPPSLAVVQMLAAGLITQDAYAAYVNRAAASGGSSCGSSCSSGGDGGCGDGGGGDGGGCGSSCGGGCGGGCGS